MMQKVVLDYNIKKEIICKIPFPADEPEMSEAQTAFLCGLIREKRPKRVLEIGVAGGGTTAIVLQCLEDMGYKYEMHSVDWSERFYRDSTKQTGWLGEMAKKALNVNNHEMHLGHPFPYFLDNIVKNGKIDFVLLDTMHIVPGEILDFLCVFPYLAEGAIVCLHDISINLYSVEANAIATNVLFNAVSGDKYLNLDLESNDMESYPNIGAIQITVDTVKSIPSLFGLLTLNWSYVPAPEEIEIYRDFFKNNYSSQCVEIFDRAYAMNREAQIPLVKRLKSACKLLIRGRL